MMICLILTMFKGFLCQFCLLPSQAQIESGATFVLACLLAILAE